MSTTTTTQAPSRTQLTALTVAALGVVYGDIGTSPLYALRMCFVGGHLAVEPVNIFGILSLISWSLAGLISVKYLSLVLRADNRGEGGILALMSLVRREGRISGRRETLFILLGLFGAALLYGDGLITPAISVLSAVEGLQVATPFFNRYIVPLALVILTALFCIQRHGTQRVGSIFGPVMLVWFVVIGALGAIQIVRAPQVLAALNPEYAFAFASHHPWAAFITMGAVFLVMTGGEDLYLDMGHFGRLPIRLGWFTLVLPTLLLNYFGQGALLLARPAAVNNPFYQLAPSWMLYPLVVLATVATVIASQAVISGAFSLTRQAMQLGYCPRLMIVHTSEETIGQVYLPAVNIFMLLGTVALVVGFRSSDSLAGAYGLAVSTTMLITSLMMAVVMRRRWNWPLPLVLAVMSPIWAMDVTFFLSNTLKIAEGGWVGAVVAVAVFTVLTTWKKGRDVLGRKFAADTMDVNAFLPDVARSSPLRVPGTAVFLTGNPHGIPRTLLHNFKHNKILHEQIVLLSIRTEEVPRVPEAERLTYEPLSEGFHRISLRYGFSEDPNLPADLAKFKHESLDLDAMRVTFFLGRETLIIGAQRSMRSWRKHLFSFLSRNARDASKFFHLPPNRVIEIGIQVEL